MTILTPQQIAEFKQKLATKGEKVVREELANHIYGETNKRIVENWLEEIEKEQIESRFQQELERRDKIFQEQMQREEVRFQAQLNVSISQAESTKSSARWAMISAVIAIVGALISIAPFLYSFLKNKA